MKNLSDEYLEREFDRLADLKEEAIAGMKAIREEQSRRKSDKIEILLQKLAQSK